MGDIKRREVTATINKIFYFNEERERKTIKQVDRGRGIIKYLDESQKKSRGKITIIKGYVKYCDILQKPKT